MPLAQALNTKAVEYMDLTPAYFASVSKLVNLDSLCNTGLKVAVDSMFGVGAGNFKRLLSGGTTQITEINGERNPCFPGINPERLPSICRSF